MRLDARLAPRLPLRAPAQLVFSSGRLQVLAEDFAAGGCGLVAPMELHRGEAVFLTMQLSGTLGFSAHATVAWATPGAPHRTGIAFGPDRSPEREQRLRAVLDALTTPGRPLAPLHPDSSLRATRFADPRSLSPEERDVLAMVMDGATVIQLLRRAPGAGTRRALLLLRARGLVADGPPPLRPRPHPSTRSAQPGGSVDLAFPAPPARTRRAAACLEMGREERAHGHLPAALEWLQAAAAEAPLDAEIGAELDALTLMMGY